MESIEYNICKHFFRLGFEYGEKSYQPLGIDECFYIVYDKEVFFDTVDGRWWLFVAGNPIRRLSDSECANVIWGTP